MIYQMVLLHTPGYRFEWHPDNKQVYAIELSPDGVEVGEPFAFGVESSEEATRMVLVWSRGYKEGRSFLLDRRTVVG